MHGALIRGCGLLCLTIAAFGALMLARPPIALPDVDPAATDDQSRHELIRRVLLGDIGVFRSPAVTTWLKPYEIATPAMEPSIAAGDYVLADRLAYRSAPPGRGDIVVFQPTEAARRSCGVPAGPPFVKRVVGVAGDQVTVRAGHTLVNGEESVVTGAVAPDSDVEFAPVPADSLLVLGDKGPSSCDSHEWREGVMRAPFVPLANVIGRVEAIYHPRDRVGFLLPGGGLERVDAGASPAAARFDFILALGDSLRRVVGPLEELRACATHRACHAVPGSLTSARLALARALGAEVRRLRGRARALGDRCTHSAGTRVLRDLSRDRRALLRRRPAVLGSRGLVERVGRRYRVALLTTTRCSLRAV
jgi:signal peptidase I